METIGVVGALIVGVAGFVVAVLAHRRAGEANEVAERANEVAAKAVVIAEESNRIAEYANEISRDAQQVVAAQASQQVEQWLVDWSIGWDTEHSAVVSINTGRDVAHRVTVIVRGEDFHEVCGDGTNVAGGANASFPVTQIGEVRAAYIRNPTFGGIGGNNYLYENFRKEVTVTIHWFTGLGQPREKSLDLVLK